MPQLELLSPTGEIQRALQRSIDLVSFGLQAAERLEVESLEIPGLLFQLTPAQNLAMDPADARNEFQTWVLANGLRDCVDALGPSLEWARKICFLWSRKGDIIELDEGKLRLSAQLSGEEWNSFVVYFAREFEFWPLRKKLKHFETEYGLTKFELSDEILSVNYARNCLTHRMGIVGPEDTKNNVDGILSISWKRFHIQVQGVAGVRVLELPARVEKGETLSPGITDVKKDFALGERIQFSPAEFVDISTTFLLFAFQIEKAIHAYQQARRDPESS